MNPIATSGFCYQRKTVPTDIDLIAPHLRRADADECKARHPDCTVNEVLAHGLAMSQPCHTIVRTRDSRIIGLWGVQPSEPNTRVGIIWMCGTDELVNEPEVARGFLRGCRKTLPLILSTYPILTNLIDSRNIIHIRFIEWLGFEVTPGPIKISGVDFYQFRMLQKETE